MVQDSMQNMDMLIKFGNVVMRESLHQLRKGRQAQAALTRHIVELSYCVVDDRRCVERSVVRIREVLTECSWSNTQHDSDHLEIRHGLDNTSARCDLSQYN